MESGEGGSSDRYRMGQEKDVYAYYLVVVAHDFVTFDVKLDELLNRARGLSSDILNGVEAVSPAVFGDLEAPDGGNAFGDKFIALGAIASLDPDSFEAFCPVLWGKQGFSKMIRMSRVGDGGVDIVAMRGKEGVLIQCKSSSINGSELGWEAVQEVSVGAAAYSAQFLGARLLQVEVEAGYRRRGVGFRFLLAAWKRE